jgi:peptide/nickel transport system ATP-binding protein
VILSIENLSVTYKRNDGQSITAVDSVSLTLNRGEILGLVGESGCGKSTLGKAIMGIEPASQGRIRFEGNLVTPLERSARPIELRKLQLIFQDPYSSLNPRRRIGDQLIDGLINQGDNEAEAREYSAQLLEKVGLSRSALDRFTHQFSGGQRQRIAIARALSLRPSVVIADEPISALDASAQAQVSNLLLSLTREFDLGMIFISHDLSVIRQITDRTAVMYLGKIVEIGETEVVWRDPAHPYTQALIEAIPKPDGKGGLPRELPGDVPDPRFPPSGCRFHPRCPKKMTDCELRAPQLISLSKSTQLTKSTHFASCLLHEKVTQE